MYNTASTVNGYCIQYYGTCVKQRKQTDHRENIQNKLTKVLSLSTILGFEVVVCGCSVVSSVNCADLRWLTYGLIQRHH